jgi:hypothetical protein
VGDLGSDLPGVIRTAVLAAAVSCLGCPAPPPHAEHSEPVAGESDPSFSEKAAQLRTLGYLGGTTPSGGPAGVVGHLPGRTAPGLNLVVSGHGPELTLMSTAGETLHAWKRDVGEAFPGRDHKARFFRRGHVFPDGDVLAVYAQVTGLVRLDRCSNVVWAADNGAHHDFQIQPNGEIVTLVGVVHVVPALHPREPVLEDFVVVLDPSGEELRRVSVLDAWLRSDYAALWDESLPRHGDVFHTNSVFVLRDVPEGLPDAFRPGRVLVSIRQLSTLALIDLDSETVVWALTGTFRAQHSAQLLDSGRILLFDNAGLDEQSRILELDAHSGEPVWTYPGPGHSSFFSATRGQVQRLPNGDTLVVETNPGRAFEVSRSGETVWEYVNPQKTGKELVAPLLDVLRLPPDLPADWVGEPCPGA